MATPPPGVRAVNDTFPTVPQKAQCIGTLYRVMKTLLLRTSWSNLTSAWFLLLLAACRKRGADIPERSSIDEHSAPTSLREMGTKHDDGASRPNGRGAVTSLRCPVPVPCGWHTQVALEQARESRRRAVLSGMTRAAIANLPAYTGANVDNVYDDTFRGYLSTAYPSKGMPGSAEELRMGKRLERKGDVRVASTSRPSASGRTWLSDKNRSMSSTGRWTARLERQSSSGIRTSSM
jgi:hypothetical protein